MTWNERLMSASVHTVEFGGTSALLLNGQWIPALIVVAMLSTPRIIRAVAEFQRARGYRSYLESLGDAAKTRAEIGYPPDSVPQISSIDGLLECDRSFHKEPPIPVENEPENVVQQMLDLGSTQ